MKYQRLIRELTRPQCLEPRVFSRLTEDVFSREPARDICGGEVERPGWQMLENNWAVIPVHGVLARNLDQVDLFGATDYDEIQDEARQAAEAGAEVLVFEFDTPGGSVSGVMETARMIAESEIPTVAFIDDAAYSAGYWLASQCDYVVALESAGVGSIGVYLPPIYDASRAMANAGIDVHFIRAGKHKASGAFPEVGITEEELNYMRADVAMVHGIFKSAVNAMRPEVTDDDMEGQTFFGLTALSRGLVDVTISDRHEFTQTVQRLLNS